MTEKSTGKFLLQLEQHLIEKNPVLLQTAKAYHELDQINYDLGLIDMGDSVASKLSWWPLITVIGSPTSGKAQFINHYLKTQILPEGLYPTSNRFSVFFHSDNEQIVTLPGTAVDRDPRFPFYHISDKIELLKSGEGRQINSYMDLKTCNSSALNGRIIISAPEFSSDPEDPVTPYLTSHIADISDLVVVFFDASQPDLEPTKTALNRFIETCNDSANPDKFIFIVYQNDPDYGFVDLAAWQNRLKEYGLHSGKFFKLQKPKENRPASSNRLFTQVTEYGQFSHSNNPELKAIEQFIANVDIDSAYRIVGSLEDSIHAVDEVVIHEVREGLKLWKTRVHFTITLVLSCLAVILVMAEIQVGFLAVFIDPIIGPASLAVLITAMIPLHIFASKQHAKWISKYLEKRRKELGLVENLAALFEKSLTASRMLLPITEPVGWNKATKLRLAGLLERSKELVQSLNDSYSTTGHYPLQ